MIPALLAALGCDGCGPGAAADGPESGQDDSAEGSGPDTAADTAIDTGDTGDTDTGPAPDSCDADLLDDAPDADGDGFIALDAGGDDCDDTRDNVYPGAPDPCDDLDQDCDGEPIPEGTCGETGDIATAAWVVIEGNADVELVSPANQTWHGDGRPWLGVAGSDVEHEALSRAGFFDGPTLGESPRPSVEGWSGTWGDALAVVYPAGDVDADGEGDAWAHWQYGGSAYATLALLRGPLPGAPCSLEEVLSLARTSVSNNTVAGDDVTMWDAGFDADGDGLADARVSLAPPRGETRQYLLDGATAAEIDGDVELDLTFDFAVQDLDYGFASALQSVPDLDGDGADEIVVLHECGSAPEEGGIAVVSGSAFVDTVAAQGAVSDAATLICSRGDSPTWYLSQQWNAPDRAADVDGDGHPDLLIGGEAAADEDGFVAFLDLHVLDDTPMEDRVLSSIVGPAANAPGASTNVRGTHFGPDPSSSWLALSDRRGHCLFRLSDFPLGGVTDYETLPAPCFDDTQNRYTTLVDIVDLDGDGYPEWLFSNDSVSDGLTAGRVTIVHGFEPPYDDESRW